MPTQRRVKKKKMKVAVIGVGKMGRHHARNYYEMPEAELAAICDIKESTGKPLAKKFKCTYYKDFRAMLRTESLDALSVVVPTKSHYQVAREVLRQGVHILVEKPITETMPQARALIKAAKHYQCVMAIGHIERFNPAVQQLKKIIDAGKLGTITSISAKRVGPFAPQIKDANVLIDLAVHDIDIFSYLLDREPTTIHANGGKAIHKHIHDYAEIFLTYKNISGYIQVNWITPVIIRELTVTGTKAFVKLNYITQEIEYYKSSYKTEFTDHGDFIVKFGNTKQKKIVVPYQEPLRAELSSFLSAVRCHATPAVTGTDGMRALSVARTSIKQIQS